MLLCNDKKRGFPLEASEFESIVISIPLVLLFVLCLSNGRCNLGNLCSVQFHVINDCNIGQKCIIDV